jgi:hypothetical protein
VEDLTSDTFKMLKNLSADSRIAKVWSFDGNLRYTLAGETSGVIRKVKSVYDPIDKFIPT